MLDVHFGDSRSQEESLKDGTLSIQHCHDNSHSREDREREKKVARKRLYVASVVCVIFMTGEILGEFSCFTPFFLIRLGHFFLSNYHILFYRALKHTLA